jgi:predicted ATPase
MKPDETDRELLRLAQELDEGRAVDWQGRDSTDPVLAAGIQGLRELEALAAAMERDPEPLERSASARAWLEPGAMLGRYPVEREAGRGGMGVVYLARDPVLDRPVALKLLPPDVASSSARWVRFTSEAKLLASLNHPNVATIHGLEESEGHRFLVLEWVAGETLAARLRRGPLPWRDALDVCGQIARGLAAAHEGGVIHRDLKPGNVMITPQGRAKVLDFGLARRGVAPGDLPAGPSDPYVQGTWGYVSPECLTRAEDHRADVFAFGCLLYESLAGVPAFPGDSVDEIRDALLQREPDEARLPAETPPAIRRLIASCVVKDPERRLGSMREALRTIEAALGTRLDRAAGASEAALAIPHQLPDESDAFIGRESELGELAEKLRSGARLVTLRGPGGMGKTRLAVRYGWRSLEEWPGGVWFCDLTEARSRDGIAAAVAQAMGVSLGAADPVVQVGHSIGGRGRTLMILDNFEQVTQHATATVAHWLERATDARFLVTSREALALGEEVGQLVEPLGGEPGVELFVERARTHRPGFVPEGPEAKAVREAVRLLEGMPLAIELAAARIRLMSPVQIVERMRERFRLLAGGGGGRHGTLRAVIDGSWDLLAPWERTAFAQCAVFEGGFTLEAAEAVLDLSAWNDAPWTPDVVQSLVDRSLLRSFVLERAGGVDADIRFGMFVSLHEYARERLAEDRDGSSGPRGLRSAEERHSKWYARYGSDAEIAALNRPGGPEKRRALARELDNLMASCRRAAARADGETAAASYRAIWDVLQFRGPAGAAVELGRESLGALREESSRRLILTTLGNAEWRLGEVADAVVHLEEALELHREAGDRGQQGNVHGTLGNLHVDQNHIEAGRTHLQAALGIARELGNRRSEGIELARLSLVSHVQERLEEGRGLMQQALAIARELGDRNFECQILGHIGIFDLDQGRMDEARTHLEAALAISREVENRRYEGIALRNLATVAAHGNQLAEARTHLESALVIAREVGSRSSEGHALRTLGSLHLDHGRMEEARAPLEAALVILRELGERRFEGFLLGELGRLTFEEGRRDEARKLFAQGDQVLRETNAKLERANLFCMRSELERRNGDLTEARATFEQAETLAADNEIGPDSDLGKQLERLRQALAAES